MFTGLVECVGKILAVSHSSDVWTMKIGCPFACELRRGQSISVSGACLTAISAGEDSFVVEMTEETWDVTRFHTIRAGSLVNLERALHIGDRLDGHFVSGHIDCLGIVQSLSFEDRTATLWITLPERNFRYIVRKGSVAIEGVSLTVADVNDEDCSFSVAVIPETLKGTSIGTLDNGDKVNIETDMIGKYVERLMGLSSNLPDNSSGLTMEKLAKMGW